MRCTLEARVGRHQKHVLALEHLQGNKFLELACMFHKYSFQGETGNHPSHAMLCTRVNCETTAG
eukprot:6219459-Amphidinium_carterae.1